MKIIELPSVDGAVIIIVREDPSDVYFGALGVPGKLASKNKTESVSAEPTTLSTFILMR